MEKVENSEKVMKMALIHDIAESRTGDVNYLQRQYVIRHEDEAMEDILTDTILKEELLVLWKEYEKKESIEAKIVKDADNLDVDFELQEQKKRGVYDEEWMKIRKHVAETKLYTKSAKKLWDEMQNSNPFNWHITGKNRFNNGDWKK